MSAIESVRAQQVSDWELILVDDRSTDRSLEIARRMEREDRRVRCIQLEENSGAAVARNAGLAEARGRYVAFLDSDDEWCESKLAKQVEFMRTSGAVFVCSAYEKIDEFGNPTGRVVRPPNKMTYQQLLKGNRVGCLTAIYDTQAFGKVEMPLLRKRQDYGLWLRLLKKTNSVFCLPDVLARYRVRSDSISSNKLEMVKWHWRLFREIEGLPVHRSLYYLAHNVLRKLVQ